MKTKSADDRFSEEMLTVLPSLRAFAVALSGNPDRANDLVQETLLRAWTNREQYKLGTRMAAWLFTILRNQFRSEYRKRKREVEDANGSYTESLKTLPTQEGVIEFEEFRGALGRIPAEQREALLLVSASGFTYDEAALICGCAVGTVKSRVNRARRRLTEMLGVEGSRDFGPDKTTLGVLNN